MHSVVACMKSLIYCCVILMILPIHASALEVPSLISIAVHYNFISDRMSLFAMPERADTIKGYPSLDVLLQ